MGWRAAAVFPFFTARSSLRPPRTSRPPGKTGLADPSAATDLTLAQSTPPQTRPAVALPIPVRRDVNVSSGSGTGREGRAAVHATDRRWEQARATTQAAAVFLWMGHAVLPSSKLDGHRRVTAATGRFVVVRAICICILQLALVQFTEPVSFGSVRRDQEKKTRKQPLFFPCLVPGNKGLGACATQEPEQLGGKESNTIALGVGGDASTGSRTPDAATIFG